MKKNCLIIGFGSIGARHADVLKNMGHEVHVVSRRRTREYKSFQDIPGAFRAFEYGYAVICTPTSDHYQAAVQLYENGFKGSLLVEKPLYEKPGYLPLPSAAVHVGYNLRFHPILKEIRRLIQGKKLYSMHVYCGQYLPFWRKDRDYRNTYSASVKSGGGVLRDLSHELDYVCRLTGKWKKVAAKGGRVSSLEIDSEDLFCLLMETQDCPAVSLQVNYLDLNTKREIILNGAGLSLKADLVGGTLEVNGHKSVYTVEKDDTYRDQHLDILLKKGETACSYEEGIEIVNLIEAVFKASREGIWVNRN
ncbi:MAG: Gfo/Idh/MocA family oxidoreductase [Desulfobacula sp.]|jgi:predicted dehydrogenase